MPEQRISTALRRAEKVFQDRRYRTDGGAAVWLKENYYLLSQRSAQARRQCRLFEQTPRGRQTLAALTTQCAALCGDGAPQTEALLQAFPTGLTASEIEQLPLALTCSLLLAAAQGLRAGAAAGEAQVAAAVRGLHQIESLDLAAIGAALSRSEPYLREDPAGIYPQLDLATAALYRRRVERLAQMRGRTEAQVAADALRRASARGCHIGELLLPRGWVHRQGRLCLIMERLMPAAAAIAAGVLSGRWWLGALLFLPLLFFLRAPVDAAFVRRQPVRRLPRLDRESRLVAETGALVTVSVLLPAPDKMAALEAHLEQLYLSNCVGEIRLCCLADLKVAAEPSAPGDPAMLRAARDMTERLNQKYGGGFLLAVRPRVYSRTQRAFEGAERKRGAITALVEAIHGDASAFMVLFGDTAALPRVRYLIALDADTEPYFDVARDLLSVALFPAHRPVVNAKKGRVTGGYGILVPQLVQRMDPESSPFARLMTGEAGVAAYGAVAGEKHQLLFGKSVFCGKGLIDVAAYHKLIGALPKEWILSHDSLEGGLLRAGYCGDLCMTESFPQSERAYFRRLDRWVRGDWQNLRFVFGRWPFSAYTRLHLLENSVQALAPLLCLLTAAAGLAFPGKAGALLALAGTLGFAGSELFAVVHALANGGFSALSRLFYSETLPAALHALLCAGVKLCLWVRYAAVGALAAGRALWRMLTKRNLLQWTTAAGSEGAGSLGVRLRTCLPTAAVAVAFLVFGTAVHRVLAILLLGFLPLTLFSGRRRPSHRQRLSADARERLLAYAGATWEYFERLCTAEHHDLPPDNLQLSPQRAVAARTSPTNIGLMMASALAARDLGLLSSAALFERLNRTLTTVERLEKYHGNLYNWYSTKDLTVLGAPFVSTVDSGNFLCALTALQAGLQEYCGEEPRLQGLIRRIAALRAQTDLTVLYAKQRQLFRIGIFPAEPARATGHYDLFMSEARMTAYYAVAERSVPREHWGALGRITVGQGRYSGLVSWTGTAFEYFMPSLFLPTPKNSLTYESLLFCAHCQRTYAGKRPFGVSESGFYAFDGRLNYQYKAHGVPRLGLKKGLELDYVAAPYASFLMLSAAPAAVMRNLKRMERMGMLGELGFYEAADFTRARRGGEAYKIVRSYMAHHAGMSLLAIDNALCDRRMQQRFLRDSAMRGAQSLLAERIPKGTVPFHDLHGKVPRTRSRSPERASAAEPAAAIYSNGRMTVCLARDGTGYSLLDGLDLTVRSAHARTDPRGIFAVARTAAGRMPLTPALGSSPGIRFDCRLGACRAEHSAENDSLRLRMETSLLQRKNCELRKFTVENRSAKPVEGALLLYLEPCLTGAQMYAAHPAFAKLFVIGAVLAERHCTVFTRTDAQAGQTAALAVGLLTPTDARGPWLERSAVLTAPYGIRSLGTVPPQEPAGSREPCWALELPFRLPAHGKASHTLCVAAEETAQAALHTLLAVRAAGRSTVAGMPFGEDAAERAVGLRMLQAAMRPRSAFAGLPCTETAPFSRTDLWSFGVSGDHPIVLVQMAQSEPAAMLLPYIRADRALRAAGIALDLVLAYDGAEGYGDPVRTAVRSLLQAENCELMLGVNGGIHLAPLARHALRERTALLAAAAVIFRANAVDGGADSTPQAALPFCRTPEKPHDKDDKGATFTGTEVRVPKNSRMPRLPWSMVYANPQFGTLLSDKSLGFTWAINAHENRLTPWSGDPLFAGQGELLLLRLGNTLYDLAALGDARFTPREAVWCGCIAGISFTMAVDVARIGMVKRCRVQLRNKTAAACAVAAAYQIEPLGSAGRLPGSSLFAKRIPGGVLLHAAETAVPGWIALQGADPPENVAFSAPAFFSGQAEAAHTVPQDCIAAVTCRRTLQPGETAALEFTLSWAATAAAAAVMPAVARFTPPSESTEALPATGNAHLDRFARVFLYHQVRHARFFGRVGPQQCAGAFGFRDQLQDCLALLLREPALVRRHLLRCAAVQFPQGDVLHWWHVLPGGIAGVRTRCSDDLLWLPLVLTAYLERTGDYGILAVPVPYLEAPELQAGERERYLRPVRTAQRESLLAHCLRALEFDAERMGPNGLPLIGSCDWNDGYSAIGTETAGESVWLAMFRVCVLRRMAAVCRAHGQPETALRWLRQAQTLCDRVEQAAWRGDHYARAILPSGEDLGGAAFLDLLPQAFAVFAGLPHAAQAVETATARLFDRENGMVRLLDPPFRAADRGTVGYIAAYPTGVRENGGQYTHAAVWLAMALLQCGKTADGVAVLEALNPLRHAEDSRYGGEPYALAADISYGDSVGRCGWTHYTGSAGWYAVCLARYRQQIAEFMRSETDRAANR